MRLVHRQGGVPGQRPGQVAAGGGEREGGAEERGDEGGQRPDGGV